jgi:excisionase family DNA binding protein
MEEIFELIKAFNRLKEKIIEISEKIDSLLKRTDQQPDSKYVEEEGACKLLKICPRTLAKMRAGKKIPFIRNGHKVLYRVSDLHEYLQRNITRISLSVTTPRYKDAPGSCI